MQYLLLIYENEKRFSQGYDKAEMGEYQAFGKEFAKNIKGGNALQATSTAKSFGGKESFTPPGPAAPMWAENRWNAVKIGGSHAIRGNRPFLRVFGILAAIESSRTRRTS